jgi:hypothetical protein
MKNTMKLLNYFLKQPREEQIHHVFKKHNPTHPTAFRLFSNPRRQDATGTISWNSFTVHTTVDDDSIPATFAMTNTSFFAGPNIIYTFSTSFVAIFLYG